MNNKNQPVHEIRLGRIKATLWAHETKDGRRFNVTLGRLYKEEDQWKTSDSFGRDDLPVLGKVLDLAYYWIFQQPV